MQQAVFKADDGQPAGQGLSILWVLEQLKRNPANTPQGGGVGGWGWETESTQLLCQTQDAQLRQVVA